MLSNGLQRLPDINNQDLELDTKCVTGWSHPRCRTLGITSLPRMLLLNNGDFSMKFPSRRTRTFEAASVLFEVTDYLQASDINVQVIIRSTHEDDIKNVVLSRSQLQLGIEYDFTVQEDMCTDIRVLVSFRPWPKRTLRLFELRSTFLDLAFDGNLEWEINYLVTHTSHGVTEYFGSQLRDPLITHNISSTSLAGSISGYTTPLMATSRSGTRLVLLEWA